MKNEIKEYLVSSADWEIKVDAINMHQAAISGLLFQYLKFKGNLLMSTTIMVNSINCNNLNNKTKCDFFASHNIFQSIGLNRISKNFLEFSHNINELKNIK